MPRSRWRGQRRGRQLAVCRAPSVSNATCRRHGRMRAFRKTALVVAAFVPLAVGTGASARVPDAQTRVPDVRFVATPPEVVDAMLTAARVTSADTVYDLGSGDGRIVIAAAQKYGARGVGSEINTRVVGQSNASASGGGAAR